MFQCCAPLRAKMSYLFSYFMSIIRNHHLYSFLLSIFLFFLIVLIIQIYIIKFRGTLLLKTVLVVRARGGEGGLRARGPTLFIKTYSHNVNYFIYFPLNLSYATISHFTFQPLLFKF